MTYKIIEINFADRWIDITDPVHFERVKVAVEWASVNLKRRYNVTLRYPRKTANNSIVVDLQIPDEMAENFHIGSRLRGISGYLMKHYPDDYAGRMVGKRLMTYREVNNYIPKEYEYLSHPGLNMKIDDYAKELFIRGSEELDKASKLLEECKKYLEEKHND